jgi:hypothetical protein
VRRLFSLFVILPAIYAAACSGGGTVVTPPPPMGPFSNIDLNGQYAFLMTGSAATGNTTGSFGRVGSFNADGAGNIKGGVEDVNFPGQVTTAIPIMGGTYSINPDGRGTITLTFGNGASNLLFAVTLTSKSDGLLIDVTSNQNQFTSASGNFFKQNPAAFVTSGIGNNYVFDFAGTDPLTTFPASFIGRFNSSGNGQINSGVEDINSGGQFTTNNPFTGNYSIDAANASSGRGTATIDGLTYAFYIVDQTRVRFLGLDVAGLLTGDAVQQQANVPTTTANISGGFVFAISGSNGIGPYTRLGRFSTSAGGTSQVIVDSLAFIGTATLRNFSTNLTNPGTVTIDATGNGRGTITFRDPNLADAYQFVFYLSSPTQGVIQDVSTGGGLVGDGSLSAQTDGPFSSTNISGTYALNWSGIAVQAGIFDEEDVVGQVALSSLSVKGASDINSFGTFSVVPDAVTSGTLVLQGDGTGSATSQNRNKIAPLTLAKSGSTNVNFLVYIVSPNTMFIATTDTDRVVIGTLVMQH